MKKKPRRAPPGPDREGTLARLRSAGLLEHPVDRRRFLQGGLLATATALGLLPACSSDGSDGGVAPGTDASGTDAGGGSDSSVMKSVLPTAVLGGTAELVPILGIGTHPLGNRSGGNPTGADWDEMVAVFADAIDSGVTYVDTAYTYGRAQEALGQVLQTRRDQVFLTTKLMADTAAQAAQMLDDGLALLGTDHVDLCYLHSVGDRNLTTALGTGGAWPYILSQRDLGRTRFVGITAHNNPAAAVQMLQTDQVDVMMVAMNFVDYHTYNFEDLVLPEAMSRNVGVMAMKVFGGIGGGWDHIYDAVPYPSQLETTVPGFTDDTHRDAIRYIKSLAGVTGMVIGPQHASELQQNLQWAIETTPFTPAELQAIRDLGATLAPGWVSRFG